MALFPVYGRFIGDFVPHLVPADTDDDMNQLAEKVAVHSVGRRVPANPKAKGYEVLYQDKVIDPATKLHELGLRPLEWLDVRWRE